MTKEELLPSCTEYFTGDSLAAEVWIDKYALKDQEGKIYEKTPTDMHWRLAKEFARIEAKYPNPMSEMEIFMLLDQFRYIVPQGSPMYGIGNDYSITSLSNCFVIGSNDNADSYGSIMRSDEEQVQLMKRRGGVGHDLSHLRPSGSIANNSALNGMAGAVLYAQRYSNSTKEVRQGDRRGALMLTMSVKHPDAEKFVDSKLVEGAITDANISLRLTDEFMSAVRSDGDYIQVFPTDTPMYKVTQAKLCALESVNAMEYDKLYSALGIYFKKVRAKRIWDKIIQNAWKSAEPGIMFWDRIIRESPADSYPTFKTVSTNPCLIGDTIVAVADGRNGICIRDLAHTGGEFLVYSARKNKSTGNHGVGWKAEIKKARAIYSGSKSVIEIFLSDGSSFKCTEDHLLALDDGNYIAAINSKDKTLSKFYSYSNKNSGQHYRNINSKTSGFSKQYRMIWEFYNGKYNGKSYNIDHLDSDSTNDCITNLRKLSIEEHSNVTLRSGTYNPISKIVGTERHRLTNKRKNIQANAKRYKWSDEKGDSALFAFDSLYGKAIEDLKPIDQNVYLDQPIYVTRINRSGIEDVFDLIVEDNHNFYIITKTDDDRYLNSSGVLVHNCGEIPLSEYDSCRLLAINLYSYVTNPFTEQATFDMQRFGEDVKKAQRLMDDLVDLELEKIDRILAKIQQDPESQSIKNVEWELWNKIRRTAIEGRRTGLGVTAEGDMLAALGLTYGAEEAIAMSVEVHRSLAVNSYISSIVMAEERGPFAVWNYKTESQNPFVKRVLSEMDNVMCDKYKKFGRRNISNLTIAPTGTTSLMTQSTSGVEPCFNVAYKRRRRTINKTKATFIDKQGEMFEEYFVFHHKFIEWFRVNYWENIAYKDELTAKSPKEWLEGCGESLLQSYIKESPYNQATSVDVDWVAKVRMQGAIQKWVDHSISATTNIPKDTTVGVVSDIYMTAYESGCKGMTIYREGSRSGVLVNEEKEKFTYIDAVKRPKELPCDIYHKTAIKQDWMILVGKLDNKPYEIFAFPDLPNHTFPAKIEKGTITKIKSGIYKLVGTDESGKSYAIENIIGLLVDEDQVNTRRFSMMLRHHIDPKWIIQDIAEYSLITSFNKVIQRVLQNYITPEGNHCPHCGSTLVNEDGCVKCTQCGFSKCG